jgi:hypothetical protein
VIGVLFVGQVKCTVVINRRSYLCYWISEYSLMSMYWRFVLHSVIYLTVWITVCENGCTILDLKSVRTVVVIMTVHAFEPIFALIPFFICVFFLMSNTTNNYWKNFNFKLSFISIHCIYVCFLCICRVTSLYFVFRVYLLYVLFIPVHFCIFHKGISLLYVIASYCIILYHDGPSCLTSSPQGRFTRGK